MQSDYVQRGVDAGDELEDSIRAKGIDADAKEKAIFSLQLFCK